MRRHTLSWLILASCLAGCGAPAVSLAPAMPAPQMQSQFIVGWWGESGKARALTKFSAEEGRQIRWVADERGSRMEPQLTKSEADLLGRLLAMGPNASAKATAKELPDGLERKAIRHCKLFRRQKATKDSSRSVTFAKHIGEDGKAAAFSIAGKNGYQAFYSVKGRLLVAFVIAKAPTAPPDPVTPPEDNEADD